MKKCRNRGPGCSGCTRGVCRSELRRELEASLAAGQMTERFVALAYKTKDGFFSQRGLNGFPDTAMRDVHDRFTERLVAGWKKLKPEMNVHSYLSKMASYSGLDVSRKFKARVKRETAFAAEATV